MKKPPLSLYIHTPWCIHKCPYCDFNSHALRGQLPEEEYIHALLSDFKSQQYLIQNRSIQTVFIGGGTPSLFSASSYKLLFKELRAMTPFDNEIEITLEANPGTIEQDRFAAYRECGINRLSIGVQSFQNEKLKQLQRIHSSEQAIKAINHCREVGFDNVNIDLMFGLPNQTINDGLSDLLTAISLNPSHLSWYQLTLEPHTAFHQNPPVLPADETIWELQQQGQQLLKENAFIQYEISAYAKTNRACRHNLNYWEFGDYIGIGAGAHGKITDINSKKIWRLRNHKSPKTYLASLLAGSTVSALAEKHSINIHELTLEFMMNALRLFKPIPLSLFEERTGLARATLTPMLAEAEKHDLISISYNTIETTDRGKQYLNELLAIF